MPLKSSQLSTGWSAPSGSGELASNISSRTIIFSRWGWWGRQRNAPIVCTQCEHFQFQINVCLFEFGRFHWDLIGSLAEGELRFYILKFWHTQMKFNTLYVIHLSHPLDPTHGHLYKLNNLYLCNLSTKMKEESNCFVLRFTFVWSWIKPPVFVGA